MHMDSYIILLLADIIKFKQVDGHGQYTVLVE
jgi:hypothetical protein